MRIKKAFYPTACILLAQSGLFGSPSDFEEARTTTREWVNAEKTISLEATEWESKKVLLQDLIRIRSKHLEQLDKSIEEAAAASSRSDLERKELLEKEDKLKAQGEQVLKFLTRVEPEIGKLRQQLPEPLQDELAPLFKRLPQGSSDSPMGIGERMQVVTQIVAGIREFNNRVTATESLREVPGSGREAAVKTLWIGLGQAYYLAPDDAGVGIPGADGWKWQSQPELTQAIRESIALVEAGKSSNPEWIYLPVSFTKEETK